MKKLLRIFTLYFTAILFPAVSHAQYILNGNAKKETCNCYQLTQPLMGQAGSVWQSTKIDLSNSFDFSFNVYLGCIDADGADGIVFILQPNNTSIGSSGGGLGFQGIIPSIGISLDTYQNVENNDPPYDCISIQANGNIIHGNDLAGPLPVSSTGNNIEDCNWHVFRIQWNSITHILNTYFDDVFRLSIQKDIVATIFNNNPMVYWGFSAATGGFFNYQKFCTALNPVFNSNLSNNATCFGPPVIFQDHSVSFSVIQSYSWDFGDGTTSTQANPPPHDYAKTGIYQVKHSITAADGCTSDPVTKTIMIGDKPNASFDIYDTCQTIAPRIENNTTVAVGTISQWNWQLDGTDLPNVQHPDLTTLNAGDHSIKLVATSSIGCVSDPLSKTFTIKNKPGIDILATDGCINKPVSFIARQNDNETIVNLWHWDFGDAQSSGGKDAEHSYAAKGQYPVQLTATASNGCTATAPKNIFINTATAFAGNDTVVSANTPFTLHGSGGISYSWSPPTGLNNSKIQNPSGSLADDVTYLLTINTAEGCVDTSSVHVTVFKGSAIYVPTGFTPNNDELNDNLKPAYIGIKSLSYFSVFNRWGQKIFSTNDLNAGWNGTLRGQNQDTGIYAWILRATDFVGKVYVLKGSFMLLR